MLRSTLLKSPSTGEKISNSTKHIADVDKNIRKISNEDRYFDEFIHTVNISEIRIGELNTKSLKDFEG
jgi:hypothetical protein